MAPSSPSVRSTAALRCFHKRPRVHPVVVGDQTLEIRGLIRVGRHQYLSEEDIASLGMNQAVQTCTSDMHNVNKYIYIYNSYVHIIYIYNYVHIHIFIYIHIIIYIRYNVHIHLYRYKTIIIDILLSISSNLTIV